MIHQRIRSSHTFHYQNYTTISAFVTVVTHIYIIIGILYSNNTIIVCGLRTILRKHSSQRFIHHTNNNVWMSSCRRFITSSFVHSSRIGVVAEKTATDRRRRRTVYWMNSRCIMSCGGNSIRSSNTGSYLFSTTIGSDDAAGSSYNRHHHNMTDYYSLESLQRRVAMYVQQQQERYTNNKSNIPKFCIAIAGGGGHLLSTLAATPGASSILLEGTIPYSRQAFKQYIQPQEITLMNTESSSSFKYCSAEAAELLANAACQKAVQLTTTAAINELNDIFNWTDVLRGAMGVASTSVLQSTIISKGSDGSPIRSTRRSVESFGSRAYCAVQTSYGVQIQLQAQLAQGTMMSITSSTDSDNITSSQSHSTRTRFDEDVFVSHCILSCIELCNAIDYNEVIRILGIEKPIVTSMPSMDMKEIIITGHTSYGDELKVTLPPSFFSINQTVTDIGTNDTWSLINYPLQIAADRILSGRDEVVTILLPSINNYTVEVMHSTKLPPYSLVVPGSFNPIHVGHIALALAAAQAMSERCNAIWFELSITNVDKPALAIDTIIERIKYFFPHRNEIPNDICWGILLTNAPLFKQKVELLAPLQLDRKNSILHFSIGTDTLVRLIDPKYYNNSEHDMLQALNDMSCHFMVGGRLDQKRLDDSIFIAGDEVVESLPPLITNKFTILPNFRIDLSSTEIRQKMEAEKQSN
jgi:nicotinic acid mononucleotide adenylyltransferase